MASRNKKSMDAISGKIGRHVHYEMFGNQVVRSMPRKTTKPTTPDRKINQSKFQKTQVVMQAMIPFIRVGFSGYTDDHSAYHEAMSVNLQQNIFSSSETGEADYSRVILSRGELPGAGQVEAQRMDQNKIQLTWSTAPGNGGSSTDQVMLLLYCPAKNISFIRMDAASRGDGIVTVELPAYLADESLEAFISFVNSNRMMIGDKKHGISNSRYVGQLEG